MMITYGKLIGRACSGLSGELMLLSDDTLGVLAKHAMEHITGQRISERPQRSLEPMAERIADRCERVLFTKKGAVPPLSAVLADRCEALLPVILAMDDADVGAITRFITDLTSTMAGSRTPAADIEADVALADGAPQSEAVAAHVERVRSWLDESVPDKVIADAREIGRAAETFAAELGIDDATSKDDFVYRCMDTYFQGQRLDAERDADILREIHDAVRSGETDEESLRERAAAVRARREAAVSGKPEEPEPEEDAPEEAETDKPDDDEDEWDEEDDEQNSSLV